MYCLHAPPAKGDQAQAGFGGNPCVAIINNKNPRVVKDTIHHVETFLIFCNGASSALPQQQTMGRLCPALLKLDVHPSSLEQLSKRIP